MPGFCFVVTSGTRFVDFWTCCPDLEPCEASFVMSELSKSTEGFQVVFDDLPQDGGPWVPTTWTLAREKIILGDSANGKSIKS